MFSLHSGDVAYAIKLACKCHRISRATPKKFKDDKLQQSSTYIQKAHNSSSVKGKSRSATKKLANNDKLIDRHLNKIKVPCSTYEHQT